MPRFKSHVRSDTAGTWRCAWCGEDEEYVRYHDQEWGCPVYDDQRLYEKLTLEGFQAGLSWLTILRKRPAFREAFQGFDFYRVARFTNRDVQRLLKNAGIVRHEGKVRAAIGNARCAIRTVKETGSLADWLWQFAPRRRRAYDPHRSTSRESQQMSRALRAAGWSFVGPTTCYSFMQAMGMVNDHHPQCHRWQPIEKTRSAAPPQ